jgi:hypothetical protein
MIELLGGLMINPLMVESVELFDQAGRPWPMLSIRMASGYVHAIERGVGDRSVEEIRDEIVRAIEGAVDPRPSGPSSHEIARGIREAKYGSGPSSL